MPIFKQEINTLFVLIYLNFLADYKCNYKCKQMM
jgi:hypothetical protein